MDTPIATALSPDTGPMSNMSPGLLSSPGVAPLTTSGVELTPEKMHEDTMEENMPSSSGPDRDRRNIPAALGTVASADTITTSGIDSPAAAQFDTGQEESAARSASATPTKVRFTVGSSGFCTPSESLTSSPVTNFAQASRQTSFPVAASKTDLDVMMTSEVTSPLPDHGSNMATLIRVQSAPGLLETAPFRLKRDKFLHVGTAPGLLETSYCTTDSCDSDCHCCSSSSQDEGEGRVSGGAGVEDPGIPRVKGADPADDPGPTASPDDSQRRLHRSNPERELRDYPRLGSVDTEDASQTDPPRLPEGHQPTSNYAAQQASCDSEADPLTVEESVSRDTGQFPATSSTGESEERGVPRDVEPESSSGARSVSSTEADSSEQAQQPSTSIVEATELPCDQDGSSQDVTSTTETRDAEHEPETEVTSSTDLTTSSP